MTLGQRTRRSPSAGHRPAVSIVTLLCALAAAGCADGGVVASDAPPAAPSEPSVDPALVVARVLSDSTAVIGRDTVLLHDRWGLLAGQAVTNASGEAAFTALVYGDTRQVSPS